MIDTIMAWMLRALALVLVAVGAVFAVLSFYIILALVPETLVAAVIGTALIITGLWTWKRAGKILK
jgi:hypothetical protein